MERKSKFKNIEPLDLELEDVEWELVGECKERQIVRAFVLNPDTDKFVFVKAHRDDIFGNVTFIETSGGGMEPGESEVEALKRELLEELGFEVEVIGKLGVVKDYYNLINRRNINNYYLVTKTAEHESHLTKLEKEKFNLQKVEMSLDEAMVLYGMNSATKIGHLLARRELPVLLKVKEIFDLINKVE